MLDAMDIANKFIFPAPTPSYDRNSYRRHLCWVPFNPAISPDKFSDPDCKDGIPCLWFPSSRAATVMLCLHGNAEDLGMSFSFIRHMRDQFKVNCIAVEYPGYGLLNHMTSSEEAVNEIVFTVFRYLVDHLKVNYEHIIVFGRSIGSGPATYLGSKFPIGGMILVSAFASIREAVHSIAGRVPSLLFNERFPNSSLIPNVTCPTLFIHGQKDGLIPPDHSVKLFQKCRARKLIITPDQMQHNSNLFSDAQYLAVPAINFFGLPGFCTNSPPVMPPELFSRYHF